MSVSRRKTNPERAENVCKSYGLFMENYTFSLPFVQVKYLVFVKVSTN